jgi:thioesterase domain-containing protein
MVGGNCFGATLALEVAHQLRASGERVPLVALIHPDPLTPVHMGFRVMRRLALMTGLPEQLHYAEFSGAWQYTRRTLTEIWREQRRLSPRERGERMVKAAQWVGGFVVRNARRPNTIWSMLRSRAPREADREIQDRMIQDWLPVPDVDDAGDQTAEKEMKAHTRYMETAWNSYALRTYTGRVAVIWPVLGPANPPWNPRAFWTRLTPNLEWRIVPGNHWTMLHEQFEHTARALGDLMLSAREI